MTTHRMTVCGLKVDLIGTIRQGLTNVHKLKGYGANRLTANNETLLHLSELAHNGRKCAQGV